MCVLVCVRVRILLVAGGGVGGDATNSLNLYRNGSFVTTQRSPVQVISSQSVKLHQYGVGEGKHVGYSSFISHQTDTPVLQCFSLISKQKNVMSLMEFSGQYC